MNNREVWRLKAKVRQQELKRMVISHYSSGKFKCRYCGFSDIRALSIDHIKGGGNKHIRQVRNFYSWLTKNNYPDGFQVLCMNCQWIKRSQHNENPQSRERLHPWHSRAFLKKHNKQVAI